MTDQTIAAHYTEGSHGHLVDALARGIAALGATPETVDPEALALAEEFHVGARAATVRFMDLLGFAPGSHLLDVGCGIGGCARFMARRGHRVSGIDLTATFVETGRVINGWQKLDDRIELHTGSALASPFAAASFDGAYQLHVGMNIADKAGLFAEVARVLKPGAVFGVYDLMREADGALDFPVPWAATPDDSHLVSPDGYIAALTEAGFEVVASHRRRDEALAFFAEQRARLSQADGPPPLGLHLMLGPNAGEKLGRVAAGIQAGLIAPWEIVARRRA